MHLLEIKDAVNSKSSELSKSIMEMREKQMHLEGECYNSETFDDFINVLTVKLNVNLKAMTSEERLKARQTCVFDLYQNLRLEALADNFCGQDIVKGLADLWQSKYNAMKAEEFLQISTFKSAIDDLISVWEQTTKKEKVEAAQFLTTFLSKHSHGDVPEDMKHLIKEIEEKASSMMALCESSNSEDQKEFWPKVLEAYDKVAQLDIMLDGADGLLSTCKRIRDAGLSSNSMRNAKRTMEHVTKMVCDKYPCLPCLLSQDSSEEIQGILGGASEMRIVIKDSRFLLDTVQEFVSLAKYMQDFPQSGKTQEKGIALLKGLMTPNLQISHDLEFDSATRAKLGESRMMCAIVTAMKTHAQVIPDGCKLILGMIQGGPTTQNENDAIKLETLKQIPDIVKLLRTHIQDDKSGEFCFILIYHMKTR